MQGEMEYVGSSGLDTDQGCKLQIKNLHSLYRTSWLKARCEYGAEETVAPSASASSNSNGEIEMESAWVQVALFLRSSIKSGRFSETWGSSSSSRCVIALRGVPGDVGERANGAELIEFSERLCSMDQSL